LRRAERWTARVLAVGGLVGVALMVVGVMLSSIPSAHPTTSTIVTVGQIARALTRRPIDPAGLSALGIIALFLTPMVAVVCAGAAFYLDRDRRFAVVCGIVVAVLFLSLWLGRG
jgi:uncharacterized membrane protein